MGLTERALRELMRILETGKFPSDDSAASDLYFVVREALENRRTLSDRTAERDQLRILYNTARDGMREVGELLETCRIELAESRAEVERLRGENTALDDKLWINFELRMECLKERDAAIARIKAVIDKYGDIEEDQSLMDVADALHSNGSEAWHQALKEQDKAFTATARAEASESTAAGLRRALEEIQEGLHAHCNEHDEECCRICLGEEITAALAASPDDHARRIKAEGLREVARAASVAPGAKHWEWDGLYNFIISEADRLEKEATNGR